MTTPTDDPQARLRRGVYWLMITLSAGVMLGRILAVDSVNVKALEKYRTGKVEDKLDTYRESLRRRGLRGEQLEARLKEMADDEGLWDWARLRRPLLSANDRSRWCTIRVLVEKDLQVEGDPYCIDKVRSLPGWDTIDMVKHDGRLYSSKPPLLPTLMAGGYWVIYHLTGTSLGTEPYVVVRWMLVLFNVIPLVICWLLLARLVERFGTTDWGRLFVMGAATFGTFLTTFAVVINNHLPAAVCAMVAVYAATRIWFDGESRWRYFVLAGLFAALTAANELPALAFFAALSAVLLWKAPDRTLLGYLPAALLVVGAFFLTNWIAHHSLRPPYMHRAKINQTSLSPADQKAINRALQDALNKPDEEAAKEAFKASITEAVKRSGRKNVRAAIERQLGAAAGDEMKQAIRDAIDEAGDNWYDYAYLRNGRTYDSYWRDPQGVDRGEESPAVYAMHILVGHHGIFSLTPIWLLSAVGMGIWLTQGRDRSLRELTLLIAAVSLVCLAFYLTRGPNYRNYGGITSGLRWMFWFAPLWLLTMLPAVDAMASRGWTRCLGLVLLAVSVLSASYPVWNPWTSPWIMDYLYYLGWIG